MNLSSERRLGCIDTMDWREEAGKGYDLAL
jgi:hypothetical protein